MWFADLLYINTSIFTNYECCRLKIYISKIFKLSNNVKWRRESEGQRRESGAHQLEGDGLLQCSVFLDLIVQFKIKKHTALKKLMSTYCERAGLALQTIRFSFDGTRINESDSPKSLDMEDGDTIEVFQQQSGGFSRSYNEMTMSMACDWI